MKWWEGTMEAAKANTCARTTEEKGEERIRKKVKGILKVYQRMKE